MTALPNLDDYIYCSKADCVGKAAQVINAGAEFWPVCNYCVEVYNFISSLCKGGSGDYPDTMDLDEYRLEREEMGVTREQERGTFPHSYVEDEEWRK